MGLMPEYAPYASFSTLSVINPLHRWSTESVVQSGGLVDTITDVGRTPKNFTAAGAARVALATDANGKLYLNFAGAGKYTAGVAADWLFAQTFPFSLGIVFAQPTPPTGSQVILDNCDALSTNKGFITFITYSSATVIGFAHRVFFGTNLAYVYTLEYLRPSTVTGVAACVVRFGGPSQSLIAGQTSLDADLRVAGRSVAQRPQQNTPSVVAAPNTLTLGTKATAAGTEFTGRIYEMWMDDTVVSDRKILQWENYVSRRYGAAA